MLACTAAGFLYAEESSKSSRLGDSFAALSSSSSQFIAMGVPFWRGRGRWCHYVIGEEGGAVL